MRNLGTALALFELEVSLAMVIINFLYSLMFWQRACLSAGFRSDNKKRTANDHTNSINVVMSQTEVVFEGPVTRLEKDQDRTGP